MKRQARISRDAGITESGITRFDRRRSPASLWPVAAILVLGAILLWFAAPALRAYSLLESASSGHAPAPPRGLAVQSVSFRATDGVLLHGWFVLCSPRVPTVILVPGFRADRTTMTPYARFLRTAGFNVLLYDSRGTGQSGGSFSLGLREVRDVLGAVRYLDRRPGLIDHRYGVLGVSLGSGDAIVGGVRAPEVRAIVADSPYVDQRAVVDRLDSVDLGPLSLPLAPIAPWLVDKLLGARLASFSPLHSVRRLDGRGLLLIHSRHDQNPTTPLAGARALLRAAGPNASLWIAPHGGHAGALAGQPLEYRTRVVAFFRHYLH